MKKLVLAMAALMMAGMTVSYAGSACCPSKKAKAAVKEAKASCDEASKATFMNADMVKALELTPEQKRNSRLYKRVCGKERLRRDSKESLQANEKIANG